VNVEDVISSSRPFLAWLVDWYNSRPTLALDRLLNANGNSPDSIALLAVDVTVGFCSDGPLASERVGRITAPIARLFQRAHKQGVRNFLLPQDTHTEDAVEFNSFRRTAWWHLRASHCTRIAQPAILRPVHGDRKELD